ncbi:LuxR C-terminal-related transcriptional regulator [Tengunoibacter tsumagoiensis]|uniref:LuxR family transcriptional regulator n=1 Tax=Tengunoibacter tsumagoiensis TaxID=2014871 RepID=A0A402A8S1_9CHLR|nr:LuxR C-terminal-related transcriptional regulator [Tengunoibacter tsumagoiensis]GCE15560.1 LuxR family transcriptional regulator [Tengunoibacter tsumagoiensis]
MPKSPAYTLMWSSEDHMYVLHTSEHPPLLIKPENEEGWHAWLRVHASFSFQGQSGHLNVLKESRSRGSGYWYAYHTNAGRTRKHYLGRSEAVTFAHLEEVARDLQEIKHDSSRPSSHTAFLPSEPFRKETPSSTGSPGRKLDDSSLMMVTTRLSPPQLPATLVVRERLLAVLDAALSRPLTLLSASAGWGKTTLLATWAYRHPQLVPWLPLEEMDNDPTRFWTSLIEALRRCRPEIGGRALSLLQASAPLATSLTALLNELASQHVATSPILLILDDYHVINEPMIHSSLTFWLEHLPPHVHLLLPSRTDPDLPLARLRVRGHLGELRNSELRFTREETQAFLTQRMGLALSEADIALLQARTEGWIASLQLAALVLQNHATPSIYVQTLSGSQRFVLDYLREEILASLPAELQTFLLQTSWLNPLSASLCDAVREREDSAHLLEQVERANLFLHSLDEHRQWYRYHSLWAQAMQHEARRRLGTAAVGELYAKASQWYEQQQLVPEAIEAALRGEHFSRAMMLMKRFVAPHTFRNEYSLVCSWLKRTPDEVLQVQPELCFQFTLALMLTTDRRSSDTWTRSEQLLQWAEQGFEASEQRERHGDALQLHAVLAFFQEDLMHLFLLTHQAQPLLTEHSLMYPNNLLIRGLEALLAGEVQVAWVHLLEGYERIKNLGDHAGAFGAALFLGEVCLEKGELYRASHYFHQALGHIEEDESLVRQQFLLETGDTEPFFVSWAYHCLARLAYERNKLDEAWQYLSQAQALRERPEKEIHVLASGALIQARLLRASGEPDQALDLLLKWEKYARFPGPLSTIRMFRLELQLAQGDLAPGEQWTQTREEVPLLAQEHTLPLLHQQEKALLLARVHIAQKQGMAALKTLAPWKEKAQAQGRAQSVLRMQILEALAYVVCQEHSQARSSLLQALQMAQPEHSQRLFLDEGPVMESLLRTLLPELYEASLRSFVRTLLRAFVERPDVRSVASPQEASLPLEPLSDQEQRVLRLLVAGRSNPEIANVLVISVNTVKTHVQSLYRKLGVRNRVEASTVARHSSLL